MLEEAGQSVGLVESRDTYGGTAERPLQLTNHRETK